MGSRDYPTALERAEITLSGLIGSVALAQIAGWTSGSSAGSAAAAVGGMLALVTFTARIFGRPFSTVAELCFAGVAVVAILPAIVSLGESGCGGGAKPAVRFSVLMVFGLTWLVTAALAIVVRRNWSELGKAGLNLFGFVEGVMFWTEPAIWSSASPALILAVALVAAIGCGVLVGWSPKVGILIVGVALVLGSLSSISGWAGGACNSGEHADNSMVTMLSYLVVFGLLLMGRSLLGRGR